MFAQVGELASSKSAMKTLRARVERVDDHLAVDRAGDLDAAVAQVRGGTGATVQSPSRSSACLGQEVGELAGVEPLLPLGARASSSRRRGPKRRSSSLTKAMASAVKIARRGGTREVGHCGSRHSFA